MKKAIIKVLSVVLIVSGMMGVCGVTTSCKSSDKMYTSQQSRSTVVNKNYKVRGNNKNNKSTYRTY